MLSEIYNRPLSLSNVTGIVLQPGKMLAKQICIDAAPGEPSMTQELFMQNKDTYALQELFDFLPITLVQLAKESGINEVTLARIRDGERTRRDTANKLLLAMSKIYERDLNIRNVTGINVMVNKRLEKREADQQPDDEAA
jgi:hypothetical protein